MDSSKTTVKIWVTKNNFDLIREGKCPKEFETLMPEDPSKYAELTIDMDTLTEWDSKQKPTIKSNKSFLFG